MSVRVRVRAKARARVGVRVRAKAQPRAEIVGVVRIEVRRVGLWLGG